MTNWETRARAAEERASRLAAALQEALTSPSHDVRTADQIAKVLIAAADRKREEAEARAAAAEAAVDRLTAERDAARAAASCAAKQVHVEHEGRALAERERDAARADAAHLKRVNALLGADGERLRAAYVEARDETRAAAASGPFDTVPVVQSSVGEVAELRNLLVAECTRLEVWPSFSLVGSTDDPAQASTLDLARALVRAIEHAFGAVEFDVKRMRELSAQLSAMRAERDAAVARAEAAERSVTDCKAWIERDCGVDFDEEMAFMRGEGPDPLHKGCVAAVKRAEERASRLAAALRPFAERADYYTVSADRMFIEAAIGGRVDSLTVDHLRAARAALGERAGD